MNKKLRHITKEEFDTGEYGICGEIYVEDSKETRDYGRIIAIGLVLLAMLGTLYILVNLE